MPFGFFFDPRYLILTLPALALALFAQMRVQAAYSRYSQVRNRQGLTGGQAARRLLDWAGLSHIPIRVVPGQLSDNYDPQAKVLNLSEGVAYNASVAALGIAAHEIGHALQDSQNYAPLRARAAIVPAANIGTNLGVILFMVGLFIAALHIVAWVGVALFSLSVVFALITLPVELNASNRARMLLTSSGMADKEEMAGVSAVLNAAALTYVAALAQALAQLLYFLEVLGVFSNRRD
ncbi:MAG TPA: zinc metallopeptidase [Chloroflexota bacterium]|nr:zinc metallopeptidase [Chloroflexota bacterium]